MKTASKAKKGTLAALALALVLALAMGCAASGEPPQSPAETAPAQSPEEAATPQVSPAAPGGGGSAKSGEITVISREEGSGTRGAFTELFGVLDENKADMTTLSAEITNSTSVMMTSVAGNPDAIGYISLGSLNGSVKGLKIDGAEASVGNIKNGSYGISRPFNLALKRELGGAAADFVAFIMSAEGQGVIENGGYIKADEGAAPYAGGGETGRIVVAGSSSVTPIMEKLREAYIEINGDAEIEIQMSDSSTGVAAAIDGICDIGMSSRGLKDSEIEKGVYEMTIATDGIAVIVSPESPVDGLTKEQERGIFLGEITDWSELG
jgi:phosphate transport system substrate-binding protein